MYRRHGEKLEPQYTCQHYAIFSVIDAEFVLDEAFEAGAIAFVFSFIGQEV
jgi:hypothetical protein